MVGLKKENALQEDKKKKDNNNLVEGLPDPEENNHRRKKIGACFFGVLIAVEVAMSGVFSHKILAEDLYSRVLREHEMRSSGQVKLVQGVYTGETDFGYFSGQGQFAFETGTSYTGNWENSQLNGNGILNIPSEGTYQGEFFASQKNGRGTFTWSDGAIYEGEWKDDQMCGQGIYTTPDGGVYSGTFEGNNFQNGTCTFSNNTGNYILTYKDGVIDKAEITYEDGATYVGDCSVNSLNGTGTMVFASGDRYDGTFSNGYRNGQGIYNWAFGDKYDGEWVDDQMQGAGTYTYADGSYANGTFDKNTFINGTYHIENSFGNYTFTIANGEPTAVDMSLASGTTYSGAMSNGELSGQAQIQYSNGDQYSGSVLAGQKSGNGTYKWSSGASYEGSWSTDQMNGNGTYFYPENENGYKLTGVFENGKPNGECQYYVTTSTHYKTDWSKGKCVKIYE